MRSCACTRSTSVTSSVTVCSTWMRGFISRKTCRPSRVDQELHRAGVDVADVPGEGDRVGADPLAQVRRPGSAPARSRSPSGAGAAPSSRARTGASRRRRRRRAPAPRCAAGACTAWVRNTVGSPKADSASRIAASIASGSSAGSATRRMPRPPPPATALTNSGKPISVGRPAQLADVGGRRGGAAAPADPPRRPPPPPRALSPVSCRTSASGPTKTMPAARQARASSGFSDRKP